MSAEPTRQHPPTYVAPAAAHSRARAPSTTAPEPVHDRAAASHPSPLFGYAIVGLPLAATARLTNSVTCSGAVQFAPTATTRSADAAKEKTADTSSPRRVKPAALHDSDSHARAVDGISSSTS